MNGRSLFSVQLFTFLFVLYIKVFYICNHYNFIGIELDKEIEVYLKELGIVE